MKFPALFIATTVLVSFVSPARADGDPTVVRGSRVRIKLARDLGTADTEPTPPEKQPDTRRGAQVVGQVVEIADDALTITVMGRATRLTVPRDAIDSMDLSRGRRGAGERLRRGAGIGLLTGGIAGMYLGLTSGWADCPPRSVDCFGVSRGGAAVLGGIGLGALGLVVGSVAGLASQGERWEHVPAGGVRVTLTPLVRGRGLGLTVTF